MSLAPIRAEGLKGKNYILGGPEGLLGVSLSADSDLHNDYFFFLLITSHLDAVVQFNVLLILSEKKRAVKQYCDPLAPKRHGQAKDIV